MKKIYYLIIAAILLPMFSYAQKVDIENEKLKDDLYLGGAYHTIGDDETYRFEGPGYGSLGIVMQWNGLPSGFSAKNHKQKGGVDYLFRITEPLFEIVSINPTNQAKEVIDKDKVCYITIAYKFLNKLEVVHNNQVERSFELATGKEENSENIYTAIIPANLMKKVESVNGHYVGKGETFANFAEGEAFVNTNTNSIRDTLISRMIPGSVTKAKDIVANGYGKIRVKAQVLTFDDKGDRKKYPEMNAKNVEFLECLNALAKNPADDNLKSKLPAFGDFYASQAEGATKDLAKMANYNGAVAYTISGNSKKGYEMYKKTSFGIFSSVSSNYDEYYPAMNLIEELKTLPTNAPKMSRYYAKAEEANEAKAEQYGNEQQWVNGLTNATRSLVDEPAKIFNTKKNIECTGTITISFTQSEKQHGQIVNLDGDSKGRKIDFKSNDKCGIPSSLTGDKDIEFTLTQANKHFVYVKIQEAVGMSIMKGALAGSLSKEAAYMEEVYAANDCYVYRDWRNDKFDAYIIGVKEKNLGYELDVILRQTKLGKKATANYPKLQERIKNGEFKNNLESAKAIVDAMK